MTGDFCTSRTDSSAEFEEPFKVVRFTGCPFPTEVDSRHQRDVRAGFRFGREPKDRAIDHSDYAVNEVPKAMSSPEPAISTQTIGFCSSVQLTECSDIDNFFQSEKAQHYVKWFNATLANKLSWAGVSLVDTPQNDIGFHRFWNRIDQIFGGTINLIQFVSLMSILANEVRGNFTPQAEKMGTALHPGMSYLFDRIEGLKVSYNTLPGNRTAFECFNNNDQYITAHGDLSGASDFSNTSDTRWSGEVWPFDVPPHPDPAVNAFITEADFMKFRGRGFIQTTGRANYRPLIDFVLNYGGDNSTLSFFKNRWATKPADQIAFESSNHDWDVLFEQTDLIIAAEAVRIHNAAHENYLALSSDPSVLNGAGGGSLFNMGLRVSGGRQYAETFRTRVGAVLAAI